MSPITVEEEIERNPGLSRELVEELSEWVAQQPHLPAVPESLLAMFLVRESLNVDAAGRAVDRFLTVRSHAPDIFTRRDPLQPDLQLAASHMKMTILPDRLPTGEIVIIARLPPGVDPTNFSHEACLKMLMMVEDLEFLEHGSSTGAVYVFDLEGITMKHLEKLNLLLLAKEVIYMRALPVPVASSHVVNLVPASQTLLNMMIPLMGQELASRVNFHTTMQTFHKFVPKEILPREYEGDLDSMDVFHQLTQRRLQEYRTWFQDDASLRVDEAKRPGKALTSAEVFGVEAPLRELSID